jgi:hypothetical protein
MKSLEVIALQLKDRALGKIAEATGVSRQTLIAIRDGQNQNPEHKTLKAVSDYLEAQEKEIAGAGK